MTKKAHDLLDKKESYFVLKKDPTGAMERKLLSILRELRRNDKISEACYNRVRPSEGLSILAQFYG